MSKVITLLTLFIIRFYRLLISPFFPASCRFHPTCSHYTMQAFQSYSLARALWLSLKRIGRCHPWHEGGYDPLPPNHEVNSTHG